VIVADASVIVEFLLGTPAGERASRHLVDSGPVQVPALVDAEVAQALRRLVSLGQVEESRGQASIEMLQEMPLHRHSMQPLLPRLWALRHTLTAYDACYVGLAEALDCSLVTFDRHLANAHGHMAPVIVPEE
jgi:predicted nucleic acid-binding protein